MTLLRSALVALLFVVAVAGWAVAGNLYLRTAQGNAPDASLTTVAAKYASDAISAEASGNFQALEQDVSSASPAFASLKAIEAAKPAPISDLALVGQVKATMLWRAGDTALVQVEYSVSSAGTVSKIAEHYMLRLTESNWQIWAVWRIEPDPGTPLIPAASGAPGPSAGPSETPGPSETIPPFESPPPPPPSDVPLQSLPDAPSLSPGASATP